MRCFAPPCRFQLEVENPATYWVTQDISTLCAGATHVTGVTLLPPLQELVDHHDEDAGGVVGGAKGRGGKGRLYLPNVVEWDLWGLELSDGWLEALVRFPSLRHVHAGIIDCYDGHLHACRWDAVWVAELDSVAGLAGLPDGVRRVVVTSRFCCRAPHSEPERQEEEVEVLKGWGASGVLEVPVERPPGRQTAEWWRLEGEERRGGFFTLDLSGGARGNGRVLQRTVLPPGGGPHTLALEVKGDVAGELRQLAPLLAGTRVRTLCMSLAPDWHSGLGGVLAALPASVACARIRLRSVEQAREVLSGAAAGHAVHLVLLLDPLLSQEEQARLRAECESRQPLVRLEVGEARQ